MTYHPSEFSEMLFFQHRRFRNIRELCLWNIVNEEGQSRVSAVFSDLSSDGSHLLIEGFRLQQQNIISYHVFSDIFHGTQKGRRFAASSHREAAAARRVYRAKNSQHAPRTSPHCHGDGVERVWRRRRRIHGTSDNNQKQQLLIIRSWRVLIIRDSE